MFKYHKRTRQLTSSNQPIARLSDQQAGHVTHRTTSASKYSSLGLSQQLSNIQVRCAIKGNTLINGGNIQQAEFNTKDSCKPCTLASRTGYRVYRLVLATQSCTLASTYQLQSLLTGGWLHSPYCTVLHPNWLHKKAG